MINSSILKFDSDGKLLWGKDFNQGPFDYYPLTISRLEPDESGNIILGGSFRSQINFGNDERPFIIQPEIYDVVEQTGYTDYSEDIFVAKYDPDGDLIWVFSLGNKADERLLGLDINNQGNVMILGNFKDSIDLDTSEADYLVPSNGHSLALHDTFVGIFSPSSELISGTSFCTGFQHGSYGFVADDKNGFLVAGRIGLKDLDQSLISKDNHADYGGSGGFLCDFNENNVLRWSSQWSSYHFCGVSTLDHDEQDFLYIAGDCLRNEGIITSDEPLEPVRYYPYSANLGKYTSSGVLIWESSWGNPDTVGIDDIAVDNGSAIYLTGGLRLSQDFDPGRGSVIKRARGSSDAYLAKYSSDGSLEWVRTWGSADPLIVKFTNWKKVPWARL